MIECGALPCATNFRVSVLHLIHPMNHLINNFFLNTYNVPDTILICGYNGHNRKPTYTDEAYILGTVRELVGYKVGIIYKTLCANIIQHI